MATKTEFEKKRDADANRDPITGAPGAHPVGVGVGAAGGGAAGAAIGSAAGPVGTAVGAIVGAVAGGLGGKAVAEKIDPTVEDAYWREHYASRPYVLRGASYDEYWPAYLYGATCACQYSGESFDDLEGDLKRGWDRSRGGSSLTWEQAKAAIRDGWDRIINRHKDEKSESTSTCRTC